MNASSDPGSDLLEVRGLTLPGVFAEVDLTVHAGEIVGLAGLVGAGRSEILETLYGARRAVTPALSTSYIPGFPARQFGPSDRRRRMPVCPGPLQPATR